MSTAQPSQIKTSESEDFSDVLEDAILAADLKKLKEVITETVGKAVPQNIQTTNSSSHHDSEYNTASDSDTSNDDRDENEEDLDGDDGGNTDGDDGNMDGDDDDELLGDEDGDDDDETDESSSSIALDVEREQGDGEEVQDFDKKKVDDDEDRSNPQYIPKRGVFYEHDDRTADEPETDKKTDVISTEGVTDATDIEKLVVQAPVNKKPSKKNTVDKWTHDRFDASEQAPKSRAEIVNSYGYDIRNEDGPPKARRRRRYGRGPVKYTRKWEDESAYTKVSPQQQQPPQRNNQEDFPELGHRNNSRHVRRSKRMNEEKENNRSNPEDRRYDRRSAMRRTGKILDDDRDHQRVRRNVSSSQYNQNQNVDREREPMNGDNNQGGNMPRNEYRAGKVTIEFKNQNRSKQNDSFNSSNRYGNSSNNQSLNKSSTSSKYYDDVDIPAESISFTNTKLSTDVRDHYPTQHQQAPTVNMQHQQMVQHQQQQQPKQPSHQQYTAGLVANSYEREQRAITGRSHPHTGGQQLQSNQDLSIRSNPPIRTNLDNKSMMSQSGMPAVQQHVQQPVQMTHHHLRQPPHSQPHPMAWQQQPEQHYQNNKMLPSTTADSIEQSRSGKRYSSLRNRTGPIEQPNSVVQQMIATNPSNVVGLPMQQQQQQQQMLMQTYQKQSSDQIQQGLIGHQPAGYPPNTPQSITMHLQNDYNALQQQTAQQQLLLAQQQQQQQQSAYYSPADFAGTSKQPNQPINPTVYAPPNQYSQQAPTVPPAYIQATVSPTVPVPTQQTYPTQAPPVVAQQQQQPNIIKYVQQQIGTEHMISPPPLQQPQLPPKSQSNVVTSAPPKPQSQIIQQSQPVPPNIPPAVTQFHPTATTGYPPAAPYANGTNYTPSGITYYAPQTQPIRPLNLLRRPTNAIPILAPPERGDRHKQLMLNRSKTDDPSNMDAMKQIDDGDFKGNSGGENIDHILDNMFVQRAPFQPSIPKKSPQSPGLQLPGGKDCGPIINEHTQTMDTSIDQQISKLSISTTSENVVTSDSLTSSSNDMQIPLTADEIISPEDATE